MGQRVDGIDLASPLEQSTIDAIAVSLAEHSVLLFKGQSLSFDDLLRLREIFGAAGLTANQLLGLGRKKYYPDEVPDDITIISNIIYTFYR